MLRQIVAMTYSKPVSGIIRSRFSCRTYSREPIPEEQRLLLRSAAEAVRTGPLGSPLRFGLLAAEEGDQSALRGLGTYGVIRNPAGFLVGAVVVSSYGRSSTGTGTYLEDFGYTMESLILAATDLGLGTCWLGGFFTRGPFSRRFGLTGGERIPAVASVGVIADPSAAKAGLFRRLASADARLPWDSLFFDGAFGVPLSRSAAGRSEEPLELVRLAPSAVNRQPWRVVRQGRRWHFFLRRTSRHTRGAAARSRPVDLQRVDLGIAMCHFELAQRESGILGGWVLQSPGLTLQDRLTEYIASWEEQAGPGDSGARRDS